MSRAPLEELYDDHSQALFGFVLSLTRNESATRDVLQDVFCRLAREPKRLKGVTNVRAFLFRIAHRLVIDAGRREQTRTRYAEAVDFSELFESTECVDESAYRKALANALEALPMEQRAVVFLKLWEGQTFESIADSLGISRNTAASRYRYGVEKLRMALSPIYQEIR